MLLTSLNLSPPKIKYSGGLLAGHLCKFFPEIRFAIPRPPLVRNTLGGPGNEILGQF